jgi:hypothetical protein
LINYQLNYPNPKSFNASFPNPIWLLAELRISI